MPMNPFPDLLQHTPSLLHCESPDLAMPLRNALEDQGLRVSVSSTWQDASVQVRRVAPAVLITVVSGPVTYACDLVDAFKELDVALPIVVMGNFPRPEDQLLLLRHGQAFEVLPLPPDGLSLLTMSLHRAVRYRARLLREIQVSSHHPAPEPRRRNDLALTPREAVVLPLVAEGLSNKKIAETLNLSEHTIRNALARVFNKLGAQTRLQCINRARELSLLR